MNCRWHLRALALFIGATLLADAASSQDTRFSGYVFGDYYWNAAGHDAAEGNHGLWFRRIYLTLDHNLAENWSMRLRGEFNQPGDFESNGKMEPYVKDAYLRWHNNRHQVFLGLAPTPTFELIEKMWGYRAVEKTPLDFYRFGSSRDIGLAAMGKFDAAGRYRYHLMVGNGSGTGTENNKGKKAMLALAYSPLSWFTIEGYGDYEDQSGGVSAYTVQGAAFVQNETGRLGIHYAHQIHDFPGEAGELSDRESTFDILSVFGSTKVYRTVNAFARFDRQFQPNPFGSKIDYCPLATTAKANFLVAGIDYVVRDNVRFMPNVEVVFYDDLGEDTPATDVMPRLTFFYEF